MKIIETKVMRGPNYWSNQKKKINCDEVGFGRIRRTSNK
jgi:hypothetical protein